MNIECFHKILVSTFSYLMGSQIKGDATVEGFINALKKGARLVERMK